MDEAPITALARKRCPQAMLKRPACHVEGLVFDAVVGLPNPPAPNVIAHWTDLTLAQVQSAVERMLARGLLVRAGKIPRRPRGAWQTYRAA